MTSTTTLDIDNVVAGLIRNKFSKIFTNLEIDEGSLLAQISQRETITAKGFREILVNVNISDNYVSKMLIGEIDDVLAMDESNAFEYLTVGHDFEIPEPNEGSEEKRDYSVALCKFAIKDFLDDFQSSQGDFPGGLRLVLEHIFDGGTTSHEKIKGCLEDGGIENKHIIEMLTEAVHDVLVIEGIIDSCGYLLSSDN